jgi:hypothetical protein
MLRRFFIVARLDFPVPFSVVVVVTVAAVSISLAL